MTRGRALIAIGAAIVLFTFCAIVASSGEVSTSEQAVFRAINGLPEWLSPPSQAIQLIGVLGVGPLVALVALIARRPRLAVAALMVTALKLAAERIVWEVLGIHRARPGVTEPDVTVRGNTPASGLSFVSGHMILVTGLAWVITPYLRGRWRILPWLVVCLVAFARMYLGAHNPLDVVGGFALGTVIGAGTYLLLRLDRVDSEPATTT
jgi:undecaprenyl-diphosphatase